MGYAAFVDLEKANDIVQEGYQVGLPHVPVVVQHTHRLDSNRGKEAFLWYTVNYRTVVGTVRQ